jgi:hypothetical protein
MVLDERDRAGGAELLIGIGDEDDVARQRHAAALERKHRHQMHDAFSLHVQRATSVHEPILDRAAVRIGAPVALVRRNDVDVMHERDRPLRPAPLEPGVQVRTARAERAGGRVEQLHLEALPLEDVLQEQRPFHLVPRRVLRAELHVIGENLHRFVPQLVPIDGARRLGRRAGLGSDGRGKGGGEEHREKPAWEPDHMRGVEEGEATVAHPGAPREIDPDARSPARERVDSSLKPSLERGRRL